METTYKTMLAQMKNPPTIDHPWAVLMAETLRQVVPNKVLGMEEDGTLDDYVRWRTAQMVEAYNDYREEYDDEQAKEFAFADWMPAATEIAADYEIEGAAEDEAAALEDYLDGMS